MARRWLRGLVGGSVLGLVLAIVGFVAGAAITAVACLPDAGGPEGAIVFLLYLPLVVFGAAVGGVVGGVLGGTLGALWAGKSSRPALPEIPNAPQPPPADSPGAL